MLGDPDLSKVGESTKLANLEAFRDYEEGVLTLNLAGENWVRQGGYSDQRFWLRETYIGYVKMSLICQSV